MPYFYNYILFVMLIIIDYGELSATTNNNNDSNSFVNSLLPNGSPLDSKHHCPPPPIIPFASNGLDDRSSYPVGTIAAYECFKSDRHVSGLTTISCLNPKSGDGEPQWEKPSLVCEPIECGDPGDIPYGHRRFSKFFYNYYVSYECNPGYIMKGIPLLLCTKDGRWNRAPPRCEPRRECSLESLLSHGVSQVVPRKPFYKPTEVAFAACPPCGLRLCLTGFTVKCDLEGHWTPDLYCSAPIIHNCPPPSPLSIDNGYHNGSSVNSYPSGTKIFYGCEPGYILVGPSAIVCLPDETWTADPPRCAPF